MIHRACNATNSTDISWLETVVFANKMRKWHGLQEVYVIPKKC